MKMFRDEKGKFVKDHIVPKEWRESWSKQFKGKKASEETKKKMSIALKGDKNPFYGKKHTEETKKKLSISIKKRLAKYGNPLIGRKHTEESKKKMSLAHKGKVLSEETKRKIGLKSKGRIFTEETRRKMSEASKGRVHSEESRRKISQRQLGRKLTEEWKKKIGDSCRGEKNTRWKERKTITCIACGEKFKALLSKNRKYCSKNCQDRYLVGEKSPNWYGGVSFEPYGLDFNNKLKKAVRERDGCCMLCNISFYDLKLLKRTIQVHHIDYIKTNNFPQNLITLCVTCHGKTGCNRIHWKIFFQSLLKERYDYQYSQNQKIIFDFTGGKA